ncbi:hypothetical protein SCLCIDRAFT_69528, partial [Scleroderma citrinum Foug A]
PDGEKWNMDMVQFWGGWAEGEQPNTLMCYLLDELHAYKHDYSGVLCQVSHNANPSLAGD